MELDLVSVLLRAEAIACRATEIILHVWELLPTGAYWSYVGGDKEEKGEEMIRHVWAVMINLKEADGNNFRFLLEIKSHLPW